jgi:2-(1,2-epoxy-1,2-dihydrophenyl)acetyl-CoA isomerase
MEKSVAMEEKNGIALVTLNRPRSYNSFDLEMVQMLEEILVNLAADQQVMGMVMTGAGKAFCAGGDLRWVSSYGQDYGAAFHELAARFHQVIMEIRNMPKPVVAAINGMAAGGGFSMALACDFRIMDSGAILKQAYTSNGLSIDGGGTFTLPRLVGLAKALEIAAFDKTINSAEAMEWGLVTDLALEQDSVEKSFHLMKEMQKRSLHSFAASKKLLNAAFNTSLETQLEKEREQLSWCGRHADGREGVMAFLEKRRPVFTSP